MNIESKLKDVIDSVSNSYGKDFFDQITQSLAKAVNADFCFIGRIDSDYTISKTISTFAHGEHVDNFEYTLKDTPCAQVTTDGVDIYPKGVALIFSEDVMLKDMGIEAYIGASFKDTQGKVIGLVVALFHNRLDDPGPIHTLFKLFSGRISAEIERHEKEVALKFANANLERQFELKSQELKEATDYMMEQEKFASLGTLVAGIAHEVNTPLGISITASTMVEALIGEIELAISQKTLSQSQLKDRMKNIREAVGLIGVNLNKMSSLISNFKKMAVGQSNLEVSQFSLFDAVSSLLDSLQPETRKHNVTIHNNIPKQLTVNSYVGDYYQLFTNLVLNALNHAFQHQKSGDIFVSANVQGHTLNMEVKDNGDGIDAGVIEKIFEPFYTTKRGKGGTGLGLNIVYNIVSQKLGGRIDVFSEVEHGCRFVMSIPHNP